MKILDKQKKVLLIIIGDNRNNFKSKLYPEKFLFTTPLLNPKSLLNIISAQIFTYNPQILKRGD